MSFLRVFEDPQGLIVVCFDRQKMTEGDITSYMNQFFRTNSARPSFLLSRGFPLSDMGWHKALSRYRLCSCSMFLTHTSDAWPHAHLQLLTCAWGFTGTVTEFKLKRDTTRWGVMEDTVPNVYYVFIPPWVHARIVHPERTCLRLVSLTKGRSSLRRRSLPPVRSSLSFLSTFGQGPVCAVCSGFDAKQFPCP